MIFAYIDPGAGSMVIQAMIAGFLAIPFFFRSQISRLLGRSRSTRRSPTQSSKDHDPAL
jgi:hypothetical protein